MINTLAYVAVLTGAKTIHAVIGGMHLERASPHRMAQMFVGFHHFGVQRIAPLHCTGMRAVIAIGNAFDDHCQCGGAGTVLTFRRQNSAD